MCLIYNHMIRKQILCLVFSIMLLAWGVIMLIHRVPRGAVPTRVDSVGEIQDDSTGPVTGSMAPNFTLVDTRGHPFTLSAGKGHLTTLAFFCGCDRCRDAAKAIAIFQRAGRLPPITSIIALSPDEASRFARRTGLQGEVLSDPTDTVAEHYSSLMCPRLWQVSPSSIITYRSPIALERTDLMVSLQALQIKRQSR